jgi:uncharacterized membrane protein YeaQ/YmgE (transglycosylase-associated protein family)
MDHPPTTQPGLADSATTWLLGFFGAIAAFLLLPRTLKFVVKRLFFGFVGEIIAIVLAGLVAEKVAEKLGRDE